MNEIQTRITELQIKGWTIAAIADEVGVTVNAVEKWKAGQRQPSNMKAVFVVLDGLAQRMGVPRKGRFRRQNDTGRSLS